MKLRLRSAIALAGWHLISPIGGPAKPGVLPSKTPLSEWRNLGTFDSSDQCQKELTDLRASFELDTRKEISVWRKQKDHSQEHRALQAVAAQAVAERSLCVASNDPRLKKTRSEGHLSSQPQIHGDSARLQTAAGTRNEKGENPATPLAGSRAASRSRPSAAAHDHPPTTQGPTRPSLPTSVVTRPPAAGEPSTLVHSQPRPPTKPARDTDLDKPVTIASAGNLTFWRLTPGGVIARSIDGVHWRPLDSGTTSDLFAGAAPSAEICWVVGAAARSCAPRTASNGRRSHRPPMLTW